MPDKRVVDLAWLHEVKAKGDVLQEKVDTITNYLNKLEGSGTFPSKKKLLAILWGPDVEEGM